MRTKNFYQLTISAKCPVDPTIVDTYLCVVRSRRLIEVEKIIESVKLLTVAPIFQEHLTFQLAQMLQATVKTKGAHSGVETVCVAKP